jgi:hypothetical protein
VIDRRGVMNALQRMPDEAFKWIVTAIVHTVFADGMAHYSPLARASVEWARDEARRWLERHRDDAQNRG